MKDKLTDLAAGRLGFSPSPEGPRAHPPGKKNNYGVSRLGISGVEQAQAPPPVRPAAPQAAAPRTVAPAPAARASEPAPQVPAPAAAPASRGYELELSPYTISVTHFPKRLVYGVVCVISLVIGLICYSLWRSGGEGGTPQTASASIAPPPPVAVTPVQPAADANRLPARAVSKAPAPAVATPPQPQLGTELSQLLAEMARSPSSQPNPRREERPSGSWSSSPQPSAAPSPALLAAAPSPAPAVPEGNLAAPATPERIGYKVAPEGIVVSGIIRGPGGPVAVINNQFLKVGQTFDQTKVIRIDEYAVELEEGGQRFLVSLSSAPARAAPVKEESADEEPPPPPKAAPKVSPVKAPRADANAAPTPASKPAKPKVPWHPTPPSFNQ
jgi:hypothetical protein